MDITLTGKTALVTGASRGIGLAIAIKLAQCGARVIGTSTTESGAQALQSILQQHASHAVALPLHIIPTMDWAPFFRTLSDIGMPDIVVNNAGITQDQLSLRLSPEAWQTVLFTNLTAVFTLTQHCLLFMMRQKWGRIINIGSIIGSTGNVGQVNYAAAKSGLIGLSKTLAIELANKNITVNVVAPGLIKTDMTHAIPEEHLQHLMSMIPMRRMGSPDDIAPMVAFLASHHATYITGQVLHVNGGMY
jgi:3-oxoacyl-[acyl-carrier protein] reductase